MPDTQVHEKKKKGKTDNMADVIVVDWSGKATARYFQHKFKFSLVGCYYGSGKNIPQRANYYKFELKKVEKAFSRSLKND